MVIDRSKHNKYSVNLVYTPSSTTLTEQQTALSGSSLTIYISGGSGSGSGLTEEQLKKLESIEEGALVNQNAFSTVLVSDGSITNEITAQNPSDTIKFTYVSPIKISLIDGNIQISYEGNDALWKLDEDGNLWTDRNVYSTKEISAYGFSEGGSPSGGANYLYELSDVDSATATSPIDNGILQYNAVKKKWVVTDGSGIKPDLTDYATKLYVTELINLLVGTAPDVLDTIYEIAEALNNDPDYVKDIANNLSNLTNRVTKLEDMFEWDNGKIKAKADLYGVGEISAYGYSSGSPSSGAQYLSELLDVDLTNLANLCILQYNSTTNKWEATDGSNIKPDLSAYATQTWVTLKILSATESLRSEFNSEISEIENSIVTINSNITVIQGNITTINDEILAVKANITLIKNDISTIKQDIVSINNALDLLNKMFEWDGNNIKAKANLYSVGEISAYGYQDGSAGSGVQYLHELLDVTLTGLTSGLLLQWNGSKWININKDEVGLNELELLQYLTENNYAKKSDIPKTINWVNITNKPSWITDEKPTYSWTDITNKPTVFTTNIGNISDLNSSWDSLLKNKPTAYITRWPSFSEVTNKPTTLSGYGITDGVNSITLTGSGNAVTSASINGHVITLTKGSTFSLSTHNHDSVYVNVTGDTMTGTLTLPTIVVNTRIQLGNAYIEYDSTNNAVVIKNKITDNVINFYATGEVSAYGYSDGTNPSGTMYLSELKDVKLTSIVENDMLVWNGSVWVNTPMSEISTELTIDNITNLNSNWKSILKATPSSYVTRWPTISEVLKKLNLIIKLNSGTTEGTNLFTYNVTTAKTVNITPSAIGAAAKSHNHSWANITSGKPTTLAGYGITDGVNAVSVAGSGNAITAASVSGHTLTLTKGSTFLLSSAYTAADILEKLKTVDGSGSGLDADTLDGIDANDLFTNLSNSGNNISITIGGTNKTLTPAYATNTGGALSGNIQFKSAMKNDNGGRDTYLLIADCSVLFSQDTGAHFGFNGIVFCHRNAGYPINEVVNVSAVVGYRKTNYQLYTSYYSRIQPCIVLYNSKYYVALRLKDSSFNLYMCGNWQNVLSSFIQLNVESGQTYPTGMSIAVSGVSYYLGVINAATRLFTPRTIWGQSFDGTENVSGALTGVTTITATGNISTSGTFYSGSSGFGLGRMELYGATPFIDFHFGSSTADYTSRIIENTSGVLTCEKAFAVGGALTSTGLITASAGLTTPQYIQIGSGRIYWDSTNNALYVKKSDGTAINFYSLGEISAYGAGSGGSSGGGVSYLHELEDVTISSQKTNDMLKWNGSKWVNVPMSDIKPDLSNYVTKDGTGALGIWNISISGTASLASSVAWANVTGKPTKLSGYGITDAYTKTESDGRYFRYLGITFVDGEKTSWQGLGTKAYSQAYPDGMIHKLYSYGVVASFGAGGYATFELYANHNSSNPIHIDNGLQFRSGYGDDKKNWRIILDEINYANYIDTRYVKKSGDTMTGTLTISNSNFGKQLIIYRETNTGTPSIAYKNNTEILGYIGVGSSANGENYLNPVFVDKSENVYRIWHAGNDGSGSGLDADLLDGKHLNLSQNPYDKIPFIASDGVMEIGRYLDFHYNSSDTSDYKVRLQITNNSGAYTVNLPAKSGTLATLTDNVASASKLTTTTAGSATRPVYFANGIPVAGTYTFGNSSGNAAINNGALCTNLNADLLDGVHNGNVTAAYTHDGYISANISVIKNDNSGYPVYILIADCTSTVNTTSNGNHYGFTGIIIEQRTNGNTTERVSKITARIGYSVYSRYLQTDNSSIIPCIIKYESKYYIALKTFGSGHPLYFYGYKINLLDTFIQVNTIDSAGTLPEGYSIAYNGVGMGVYGNSSTATKLQTARTIWGQSFDGTANITGDFTTSSYVNISKRLRMIGTTDTPVWNSNGAITWTENSSDVQAVSLVYTSYDSYRSPAGLLLCGNQGNEWFEAPRIYATNIYSTGNVGIGTTSPSYKLHVNGSARADTIVVYNIELQSSTPFIDFHFGGSTADYTSRIIEKSSGVLTCEKAFKVGGTLSVTGTSTFTGKTTHNGGLASTTGSFSSTLSVTGAATLSSTLNVTSTTTSGGFISSSGNILQFNSYSNKKVIWWNWTSELGDCLIFNVPGNNNQSIYMRLEVNGTKGLKVFGNLISTGEVTAYSSSDIRLKKNLKELKAINTLRKINTFEYDWTEEALLLKANKNVHDYGIIAQELESIIPEAVTHDMYGKGYLGIDYTKLIPFTISAIKEVDDEVTTLKKRVKELEDRLSKYESSVK